MLLRFAGVIVVHKYVAHFLFALSGKVLSSCVKMAHCCVPFGEKLNTSYDNYSTNSVCSRSVLVWDY